MLENNFLSFDGTEDVVFFKNVLRKSSDDMDEQQDEMEEKMGELKKKSSIHPALNIFGTILYAVAIILLVAGIRACGNTDEDVMAFVFRSWWLWLLGGCSLIGAIIINVIKRKKAKEVVESEEFKSFEKQSTEVCNKSYEELNVPQNAYDVDLFVSFVKVKASGKKVNALIMSECDNPEFKVFVEDGKLCIADVSMVVGVPLENLVGIEKINKTISFTDWNKTTSYKDGEYRSYKITENKYGTLFIKPYYALKLTVENEEYSLYFPPYELDKILSVTGLKNPDEQTVIVVNEEELNNENG